MIAEQVLSVRDEWLDSRVEEVEIPPFLGAGKGNQGTWATLRGRVYVQKYFLTYVSCPVTGLIMDGVDVLAPAHVIAMRPCDRYSLLSSMFLLKYVFSLLPERKGSNPMSSEQQATRPSLVHAHGPETHPM